ncbi:YhcH/YjgK/YiaL family protein [Muribaculum intestinale]|uniref:YhcH/YjgK/YiaL family protein n=1 Tax=Muribaculum intestinale TaxID=1796646 RepID=UPI0025B35439|nr:YhcH/YjgK/YiaL family protein [Muribaculum intestinale]
MVIGNLTDTFRYDTLSPAIADALAWVKANIGMPGFEAGKKTVLADGDIVVNCQEVDLKPAEKALMEAHRDWIDIQVSIDTPELMGWSPLSACHETVQEYDSENDCLLVADKPQCLVPMLPGQFMILYPEDAHAPNIGEGRHRKYVVKVRVGK